VYLIEIQSIQSDLGKISGYLHKKRGTIFDKEPRLGTHVTIVKEYLHVSESFGLNYEN
jgi:elongation factor 2